MFVRQVKRKCNVRGCKNTDCFAISRTREAGNSVIICKSCLESALGAIGEIDPKTKSNIPAPDNTKVPPLFFNHLIGAKAPTTVEEQNTEKEPEAPEVTETVVNEEEPESGIVCPDCGKEFDSKKGLKAHTRYCKKQKD